MKSFSKNPFFSDLFWEQIFPSYFSSFTSNNTKRSYFSTISEFTCFIEKDPLLVSKEECQLYFDTLQKQAADSKIKPSTILTKKKQLSSLFSFIINNHNRFYGCPIIENYFLELSLPETQEIIHANRVISIQELDQLVGFLLENDLMCLVAVLFSFKAMLRPNEFLGLKTYDFFQNEDAVVIRLKNQQGFFTYSKLPDDVFQIIQEKYIPLLSPDCPLLFPNKKKNGVVTLRTLRNHLEAAENAVGIKYFTFNDLRNSSIAYAASNGANVQTIADTLGYKTKSHMARLKSLTDLTFPNATDYIHVVFTGKHID